MFCSAQPGLEVLRLGGFALKNDSQESTSALLLLSGGLDSSAQIVLAPEKPRYALTINYGQRAFRQELESSAELCRHYGIELFQLETPWLGKLGKSAITESSWQMPTPSFEDLDQLQASRASASRVWVPNRNGLLINIAACYAESLGVAEVWVGFNREEALTFPDNSGGFLGAINHSLNYSTRGAVQARCFTLEMNKAEIVRELVKRDPQFPFDHIWSCYEGAEEPCMKCESCMRLIRALRSQHGGSAQAKVDRSQGPTL